MMRTKYHATHHWRFSQCVAEQILLRRDKLALEWVNITKSAPSDHTDIRKLQLDRLTGVVETTPTMIVVEDDEFQ